MRRGNQPDFIFRVPSLSEPEELEVFSFSGTEKISELFRFEIKLISRDREVPFDKVVNQPAVLMLKRGDELVQIQGLVTEFHQGGDVDRDYAGYYAVLQPRVWVLGCYYQSRVFQNMSVPDIIERVLADAGFSPSDYRLDLNASYEPREYCVQYRETDLDFVNRLMEHEGIYFYFEPGAQGEVMVMTDNRASTPAIQGEAVVVFNIAAGMSTSADDDKESVRDFVYREQVVTGKVLLNDYNHRTPAADLQSTAQLSGDLPGVYYEYGDHYKTAGAGTRLAKIRGEEIGAGQKVASGLSDCMRFRPGFKYSLDRLHRGDLDLDYMHVEVSHQGGQGSSIVSLPDSSDSEVHYSNEFTCIPASVQYRAPRTTPVPRLPGLMTAKVETGGGDYAYIDEEGSYRVKMPFDLEDGQAGQQSRAIRMAQPYAGNNYGIHFPTHAEGEMVWACVDGNVDRPIALGMLPNSSQKSPASSENKTQNVIRTMAGNEIILDDTKEKAKISIATTELHSLVFDDEEDRVILTTKEKHIATFDDKNKNIQVQTTDGHLFTLDDKNKKISLTSKEGHFISISDEDEKITVADKQGKNTLTIDIGGDKITIKTADGDINLHAPNGTVEIKSKELKCVTTADTSFKAANIKSEAQADYKVKASNVTTEAQMALKQKGLNVTSEAGVAHTTKGLNVTSEASLQQQVKGTLVTVQASGINTIQGALVKIN